MKEIEVSITSKGQITLPVEARRALGVQPKDKVKVRIDGDQVTVSAGAARRLKEFYQMAPALDRPLTDKEMTEIAHEEHAQHVAREGLDT